jgi:hypothetical protein
MSARNYLILVSCLCLGLVGALIPRLETSYEWLTLKVFVAPLLLLILIQTITGLVTKRAGLRSAVALLQWPLLGAILGLGLFASCHSAVPGGVLIFLGFITAFGVSAQWFREKYLPLGTVPIVLIGLTINTLLSIAVFGCGVAYLTIGFVEQTTCACFK